MSDDIVIEGRTYRRRDGEWWVYWDDGRALRHTQPALLDEIERLRDRYALMAELIQQQNELVSEFISRTTRQVPSSLGEGGHR